MTTTFVTHKTDVHLKLNQMKQETFQHGQKGFPFQYYINEIDWQKQDCVEWHWHKELEFVIVEKASTICKVGNTALHLQEGDCILINSSAIHCYESPDEETCPKTTFRNVLFSPDFIAPENSVIYQKIIDPLIMSGLPYIDLRPNENWMQEICAWLAEIYEVCKHPADDAELSIRILLSLIWKSIWNHRSLQEAPEEINKNLLMQARMRVMLQFIWDNFSQPIKLEEIAASANLSVSMAQRCFRNCINDSPIHYLQNYRLNYAKQLLKNSNDSVLDIALKSGFGTVGYFDHLFKREVGMTPKQFARQK